MKKELKNLTDKQLKEKFKENRKRYWVQKKTKRKKG